MRRLTLILLMLALLAPAWPSREERPVQAAAGAPVAAQAVERLQPGDIAYLGAFRLPGGDDRPLTFAYGGATMAFNPDGDPNGAADGFPGSLYIMGHDRLPYGELPNGNQIAQVSIPAPVVTRDVNNTSRAAFFQSFQNPARGLFDALDEIPRVGMVQINNPLTGPRLHIAWGQHFQDDPQTAVASHAWISPSPSGGVAGPWFLGDHSLYSVNGYMMEIPSDWANANVGGRVVGAGRYRDGGWSGQGPALFAYRPWNDDGSPARPQTRLEAVPLLLYENSRNTENVVDQSMQGYQHADEWEGGAWLTSASGRSAVLFAGTKGTGALYWYGWVNPAGPDQPCIETELLGQYPLARFADGTPAGPEYLQGCSGHNDFRGWWSSRWDAQFILYDPADLARVASGEWQPWQPQPYAVIDIDDHLFLNPEGIEPEMLGTGDQRKYRIGDVAYDREHGLLYVLELFADGARPVVHVWRVQ